MMKLSDRMEMIARMVQPCDMLADIGTDHGHMPVALVERGVVQGAIAADVRPGPLSRAQQAVAREGLGQQISTRLSDGLKNFTPGEADAIVIAGMGGALVIRILKEGRKVAQSAKQMILQPQSEIAEVRRFLVQEEYGITDEDMVCEDGKYYTVIKAAYKVHQGIESEQHAESNGIYIAGGDGEDSSNRAKDSCFEVEYTYGPVLLKKSHPVLRSYLLKEAAQLNKILDSIPAEGESPQADRRRDEVVHMLEVNMEAQHSISR